MKKINRESRINIIFPVTLFLLSIIIFSFPCTSCYAEKLIQINNQKYIFKGKQSIKPDYLIAIEKGHYENIDVRKVRTLAEKGDCIAQYSLAMMYSFVPQNYEESKKWLLKAAAQGLALAQTELAGLYLMAKNYEAAVILMRKAAEQGHFIAQYNLGKYYLEGTGGVKDYKEALKWNSKAARQGYSGAQNSIGIMYKNGLGVQQNYAEALRWFRKAAQQGDGGSQFNLGKMYEEGRGVTRDYQEAVKYYHLAAIKGIPNAQAMLGIMYFKGSGVPQNYVQAYKWFYIAAESGYSIGKKGMDITSKCITKGQINEAIRLAKEEKIKKQVTPY
jgi:uncharacterized protein